MDCSVVWYEALEAEEQSRLWFIEACASKPPRSVSSAPRSHRATKLRTGALSLLAALAAHKTMARRGIVWVSVLLMHSAATHAGLLPTRDEAVEIFADIASEQASERLLTELGVGGGSRQQDVVPASRSFPCRVSSNNSVGASPRSVHRLRPQDIDVVATMGDSLVTGFGALAESLFGLFLTNQQVSWSIGGDETWRSVTTVPNLLRMFNPNLVGFAVEGSDRHFGMGEPQSHDEHLLGQAKRLVARMKRDSRVDFKRHWKMVTILSGQNDICSGDPCYPSAKSAALEHYENLRKALDYLQANLPRAYINLLPVLDVTAGWGIEKSLLCGVMSVIECRCLYGPGGAENIQKLKAVVNAYHSAEKQLIDSGRYDSKEDFTVVIQPFTSNLEAPKARNFLGFDLADLTLFSVDCFHLSQKGHAAFATMQWNNLLEPEGNKTLEFMMPMKRIRCPSEKTPYLFTKLNSRSFFSLGKQR